MGGGKYVLAMNRQQGLIGGDDVFAFADGFQNDAFRKIIAPDCFNHNLDGRVIQKSGEIRTEDTLGKHHATIRRHVKIHDSFHAQGHPHPSRNQLGLVAQDFRGPGPDGAESDQAYSDFTVHD